MLNHSCLPNRPLQGLVPGDTVTVVTGNTVNYPLPVFAAWLCGASANLLDPAVGPDILGEQMRSLPARIVVSSPENVIRVNQVLQEVGQKATVVVYDHTETSQIVESNESVDFSPSPSRNQEDLALTLWSSGSTGRPKGIQLPFRTLINSFAAHLAAPFPWSSINYLYSFWFIKPVLDYFQRRRYASSKLLMGTWMFHIGGFFTSILNFNRSTVLFIQPDKINPDLVLSKISQYDPVQALMMSFHDIIQLSHAEPSPDLQLESVGGVLPIGSAVPSDTQQKLQKIFPKLSVIINAYGSTEVGAGVSYSIGKEYSDNVGQLLSKNKV